MVSFIWSDEPQPLRLQAIYIAVQITTRVTAHRLRSSYKQAPDHSYSQPSNNVTLCYVRGYDNCIAVMTRVRPASMAA